MRLINIADNFKKVLMFSVLFLYALGPVFRVFHAYVSDIFFLLVFILLILSNTGLIFNQKISLIFLLATGITLIVLSGKLITGYTLAGDEIANFFNYVKLYFLFITVYSVFYSYSEKDKLKKDLKIFNSILIFFLLFVCAIGVLQFVHSPIADFIIKNIYHMVHKIGTDNIYEFQILNRVTGIFDSFNGMGIVLCFSLFILVFINTELKNYYAILIFLLGITLIFLTGNRASLILLFLMTLFYFIYTKRVNLKVVGVMLAIFFVSGCIFFLIADYLSFDNFIRFYEFKLFIQNGSIPPTLQVRLDKWEWLPGYMLSVKQGLFGYTTNDFLNDKIYTSPDNQYLNWLVYYGYIGSGLFIIWAIYSMVCLIKSKRDLMQNDNVIIKNSSKFFVIYWIGLIAIGFFQESFFFGRLREIFIFFLAMMTAYQAIYKRNNFKSANNV